MIVAQMFFIHKREEDCKWIVRLEASAARNEPNNPLAVFLTPNFDSPTVSEKARGVLSKAKGSEK